MPYRQKQKKQGGDYSFIAGKQISILKSMETKDELELQKGKAEVENKDSETGLKELIKVQEEEVPTPFFNIMKELTLFGYFTSEPGCKEARLFNPGR
jgi:hypothetical protein